MMCQSNNTPTVAGPCELLKYKRKCLSHSISVWVVYSVTHQEGKLYNMIQVPFSISMNLDRIVRLYQKYLDII